MKVHAIEVFSIGGNFAICGVPDPKQWNNISQKGRDFRPWSGVTCKRCLKARGPR